MILAALGSVGAELQAAVRWLNALMFGGSAFLVGFLAQRYTSSRSAALGTAFLFIFSADMLLVHSMAWSEPVFIFLLLFSLMLLDGYLETGWPHFLVGAGVAAGLSVMDRYSGLALIWTGLAGLLILGQGKLRGRIVGCLIFGGVSCLPLVGWAMRNMSLAHSATDRALVWHAIGWTKVRSGLLTASHWFIPARFENVTVPLIAFCAMTYLSGQVLLAERRRKNGRPDARAPRIPHLFVLGILCWVIFLAISISLFDAYSPLDYRMLAPVYAMILLAAVPEVCWLMSRLRWSRRTTALAGCAIILLLAGARGHTVPWIAKRSSDGEGYTSRAWKQSQVLKLLRAVQESTPIYSNADRGISFLTGRFIHEIPARTDAASLLPDPDYEARMGKMGEDLRDRNGVLLIVDLREWSFSVPSEKELVVRFRLRVKEEASDGKIYTAEAH